MEDESTIAVLSQMVGRRIALTIQYNYRLPWHMIQIEDRVKAAELLIPVDHPARDKTLELIGKDLIIL